MRKSASRLRCHASRRSAVSIASYVAYCCKWRTTSGSWKQVSRKVAVVAPIRHADGPRRLAPKAIFADTCGRRASLFFRGTRKHRSAGPAAAVNAPPRVLWKRHRTRRRVVIVASRLSRSLRPSTPRGWSPPDSAGVERAVLYSGRAAGSKRSPSQIRGLLHGSRDQTRRLRSHRPGSKFRGR